MKHLVRASMVCGLIACTPATWAGEVRRQSTLELDCPGHQISVHRYAGHNYEAYGCERAIRYTCQSRVCTQASQVHPSSTEAMRPFVTRADETRTRLASLGPTITASCSNGQPFSATVTINPAGKVIGVATPTDRHHCVARALDGMEFPRGNGSLELTQVFR